jgi:hypothetical protein
MRFNADTEAEESDLRSDWQAEAYPTKAGYRRETGEHGGSGEKRPRVTGFVRL